MKLEIIMTFETDHENPVEIESNYMVVVYPDLPQGQYCQLYTESNSYRKGHQNKNKCNVKFATLTKWATCNNTHKKHHIYWSEMP